MGQLLQKDNLPQLPGQIQQINVYPAIKKRNFLVCPFLQFQTCQQIFYLENQDEIQSLYKFGSQYIIHLQLKKQQTKTLPGIYIKIADQYVYAYKHRKLDRSDKIKPEKLLFKKRIYTNEQLNKQKNKITNKNKQIIMEDQQKDRKQMIDKDQKINQYQKIKKNKQTKKPSQQQFQRKLKLQDLLIKFAQIKLLSLLQIGPKLGRVYNGSDGIITDQYIQYFSQITIDRIENCIAKNSQLKKLQDRLVQLNLYNQQILKNENLSYSKWRKGYVLKQIHYYDKFVHVQRQSSYENQSIHFILRMFETQITKAIMDLDNEAKMLPFINNLIFQHDFQKALSKMEESLSMIQNKDQKIQYAEQISSMISKHSSTSSKEYEKRIQKIVSLSQSRSIDSLNSATTSKNNSIIFSRQSINENLLIQKARQITPTKDNHVESSSQINNLNQNNNEFHRNFKKNKNKQSHLIKNEQQKIKNIIPIYKNPNNKQNILSQQKKKQKFNLLCKSLKIHSLDKNNQMIQKTIQQLSKLQYKTRLQLKIILGKISMDNARSRHALAIFQRLLYFSNQASSCQVYNYHQIALLAGIIYYHRYAYKNSLKAFQKALNILIRLKHYSVKMMAIFNNISCIYHALKNYDKCLLYLHRGFKIGQYSVDYEYLMRSNMAMTLAEIGRIKQAKNQMMKTNNIIEPVNNMVIFCKFYSNLAYLQLLESTDNKSLEKVISSFEQACNIQQKYLIPNGYKHSIFLHNNMAMVYYRRKQYKKAKAHCQKIINQLNDVHGMVAIKVHFNIGKIFSQGYNYDIPLKHFHQARILLSKLDQKSDQCIRKYKEIINREIEQLEKMRIDQVSEEQSYKFSYMSSSLLKKV